MIGVNRARGIVRARIGVGSLLLVAVVSWGSLSFAAPPAQGRAAQQKKPETADQKLARRLLLRGQSELEQGHADLARSSLNAAKQLEDSFAVEGALADATVALGKPTAAAQAYRDFIEKNRAALTAEQLGMSDAKLAVIDAASARLQLDVSEVDADVQLDGVSVGHSPLPAPLTVDPGDHQISLSKPGFVALAQHFTLTPGVNALAMKLAPEVLTGKLHVSSNTPGVIELLVDNQVVGLLPWEGALPVGQVKLLARSNDRTSAVVDVVIERDVVKLYCLTSSS